MTASVYVKLRTHSRVHDAYVPVVTFRTTKRRHHRRCTFYANVIRINQRHIRLRIVRRFPSMTVPVDVIRVQQQLRHLPWHEHSSNVDEKLPVRSTHLSLRRRRRVFDVAAQRHRRLRPLFQASVNRSTKLTLSSSVGVCQRPGRTPSSRSSELFVLPGPVRYEK